MNYLSLRRRVATLAVLTTAVVGAALAAPTGASADPATGPRFSAPAATPFVIHETVDHSTESYTFTATGPLCQSGVFADHVTVLAANAAQSLFIWRVDTTYTCADGSGTFTAVKRLVRRQHPDSAWNRGPVHFTGGTGTYVGLSGHGMDIGASANGHGAGTITGRIAPPASAGVPFVIHETIDHSTDSYTFTATGPLCPSGVFTDDVTLAAANPAQTRVIWRVHTTYTCDDGSGTFTAVKQLVRGQYADGAWNIGSLGFTGGTGAYTGLSGHGTDVGESSADGHGTGTITGHLDPA